MGRSCRGWKHRLTLMTHSVKYPLMRIPELVFTLLAVMNLSPARADTPAVHGMLVVGRGAGDQVFLSHLPMFMKGVHDRQVILRAQLDPQTAEIYRADRQANPDVRFYTIAPPKFILKDLLKENPDGSLKSFPANLFRNHFEHDGDEDPIQGVFLAQAKIQIVEIIRNDVFRPCAQPAKDLSYYVFGDGKEYFLAHPVVKAPDYDQILRLVKGGPKLAAMLKGKSWIKVSIKDRADDAPLTRPDKVNPLFSVKPQETAELAGLPVPESLTVAPIYANYDELASGNLVCGDGGGGSPHVH
jgi:hypothetical protein